MNRLIEHFQSLAAGVAPAGPGFSAAVIQHGEVLLEAHAGLACLELQVPLGRHSAYYLGSESKPFTAACVMALVQEGRLGLDDDVARWLPQVRQFEAVLPLRSLLNHTSGIPDYFAFLHSQLGRHEADFFDNALLLQLIARMDELAFAPGQRHDYSNSNYILLAELVKGVSGQTLGQFAQQRLFEPLGMACRFDEDRFAVLPGRVRSYEPDAHRPCGHAQLLGNASTIGDGGLYASLDDLLRWERSWHARWADPHSLIRLQAQASPLCDGSVISYRFGIEWQQHAGRDLLFHGGGLWGFRALVARVPQLGLSVVHLANCETFAPDLDVLKGLLP